MKKKSLLAILFVLTFLLGNAFSPSSALAVDTVESLKKQVTQLKAQVKNLTSKVKTKDKEIAKLKKEVKTLKANASKASKTKVSYKGAIQTGAIDYKGNQYIPVSFVKDIFGIPVTYDRKADINYVGVKPNGSYMSDLVKPYYSNTQVQVNEKMLMGQEAYYKGFTFVHFGIDGSEINYNLNKKYKSLNGKIGFNEGYGSTLDIEIKIYGDGELIEKYNLYKGDLPIDIDLDIRNIKQLQFKLSSSWGATQIGFADFIIK